MYKFSFKLLLLFFIILLSGCSSKKTLADFNIDKIHELSIVNTRKAQINTFTNSRVIIVATYLNPIKTTLLDNGKENFIVGIYIDKQNSAKSVNPFYKITLNNDGEIDAIKRVAKDSTYMKMIPLVNKWADYYLIQFPKKDAKKLTLAFEAENGSKALLTFEKEL